MELTNTLGDSETRVLRRRCRRQEIALGSTVTVCRQTKFSARWSFRCACRRVMTFMEKLDETRSVPVPSVSHCCGICFWTFRVERKNDHGVCGLGHELVSLASANCVHECEPHEVRVSSMPQPVIFDWAEPFFSMALSSCRKSSCRYFAMIYIIVWVISSLRLNAFNLLELVSRPINSVAK